MEEHAALAKLVAADEGAADGSGMQDAGFLLPSTSRRVAVSIEQLKPEVLRDWVDKVTKGCCCCSSPLAAPLPPAAAVPFLLRICCSSAAPLPPAAAICCFHLPLLQSEASAPSAALCRLLCGQKLVLLAPRCCAPSESWSPLAQVALLRSEEIASASRREPYPTWLAASSQPAGQQPAAKHQPAPVKRRPKAVEAAAKASEGSFDDMLDDSSEDESLAAFGADAAAAKTAAARRAELTAGIPDGVGTTGGGLWGSGSDEDEDGSCRKRR